MKSIIKLLAISAISCGIWSCSKEPQKWEYMEYHSIGTPLGNFTGRAWLCEENEVDTLNALGEQGWELVDVFTRTETVHPNFGNPDYVTGLKPNTRTSETIYVFKRPKSKDSADKSKVVTDTCTIEVAVPEDTVEVEEVVAE